VVTSGHVIKMAVTPFDPPYPKTLCYTQTSWLYVLENRCYRWPKFYIAETYFRPFCSWDFDRNLMTFIFGLDPYSFEIYQVCENERYTSKLSIKLSSGRHTDAIDIINILYATSRVVKN